MKYATAVLQEVEMTRLQSDVPGRAGVVQKDVRVVAVLVERPAAADADLAVSAEGVGMAESHSAVRHELQVAAALHLCKRQSLVSSTDKVNLLQRSVKFQIPFQFL